MNNSVDRDLVSTMVEDEKDGQEKKSAFEIRFKNAVDVYSSFGYHPDLIQQWTLPEADAKHLVRKIKEVNPKNILEIGTFVGLTTQLLALYTSEDAKIHTVDPNLPLSVEMLSMKSNLYNSDTSVKAQDLALKAAQKLQLSDKIEFHAGGFSIANTFSSFAFPVNKKVKIVGPELCKQHGPFDFIFVDGLHYSDAVLSDLKLALQYLLPNGVIALHDVIGRWGSNVRRAVFELLDKRDDFIFSHDRYLKLYSSIGFLQRSTNRKMQNLKYLELFRTNFENSDSLFWMGIQSNLASILFNMFSPRSVIQFGCGQGELLKSLKECGVTEVCGVETDIKDSCNTLIPIAQHDFKNKYNPRKKYDLCICLGLIDTLEPDYVDSLIQSCIDSSSTIVLSCTPPGEVHSSYLYRKSIGYWVEKFFNKGYLFHDFIRPYMEPLFYTPLPIYNLDSSIGLNIYVVTRQNLTLNKSIDTNALVLSILKEKEGRIEDLVLQNFSQALLTKHHQQEELLLKKENQHIKQQYQDIINSETYLLAKKIQNSFLMKLWRLLHKRQ